MIHPIDINNAGDLEVLFSRYLAGETDETENGTLYRWLTASPENLHSFIRYKRVWDHVSCLREDGAEAEAVYREILGRIRRERRLKRRFFRLSAVAAVLLLLAGIPLVLMDRLRDGGEDSSGFTTSVAGTEQVRLPDGTLLWLNAESRAVYRYDRKAGIRKLHLDGEAYLEVARDESHPFLVHTEGMEVRVLGTRFNLAAYSGDGFVEMTVVDGTVEVSAAGRPEKGYRLAADDRAVYDRKRDSMAFDKVDASASYAWTRGELRFREERLDRIAKVLERRFGVYIVLPGDGTGEQVFTAAFEKGRTVEEILDVLSVASPLEYTICGKHIVINLKKELPMSE